MATLPGGQAFADAATTTVSEDLAAYYADAEHYHAIRLDVVAWHGTTKNSCVAFTATALRHIGAPLSPDTLHGGELASRLLMPFASWLRATYLTERIRPTDLRAGDIVFAGTEMEPRHVYVFLAWKHRKRQLAHVVDNQGRRYVRPVKGNKAQYSPFAFALRLLQLK